MRGLDRTKVNGGIFFTWSFRSEREQPWLVATEDREFITTTEEPHMWCVPKTFDLKQNVAAGGLSRDSLEIRQQRAAARNIEVQSKGFGTKRRSQKA